MSKNIYRKAVLFITLLSFHTFSSCVNTIQQEYPVQPIREELDSYSVETRTISNIKRIKNVCCALMTGCITTTSVMLLIYGFGCLIDQSIKYLSNRSRSDGIMYDYGRLTTSIPFTRAHSDRSSIPSTRLNPENITSIQELFIINAIKSGPRNLLRNGKTSD